MTEAEYIAAQDWKNKQALRRALLHVKKTGWATSRSVNETLSIAGWIAFGGPREGVELKDNAQRYNHYRLTEAGEAQLQALKAGAA